MSRLTETLRNTSPSRPSTTVKSDSGPVSQGKQLLRRPKSTRLFSTSSRIFSTGLIALSTKGAALWPTFAPLDTAMDSVSPHIKQVGVYAEQIYNQQPNRNFVRSIIISEMRVRLLQYWASHLKIPNWLASTIASAGKAPKGAKNYPVAPLPQAEWEEYLIKDLWRAKGRASEHEFLEAARGVVDVAQMVAFEEICKVSDFRDLKEGESENFVDRKKWWLTLERYAPPPPTECFRSASQALWALHDAIQGHGHRELFKAGVFHRDISIDNIQTPPPAVGIRRSERRMVEKTELELGSNVK
ncbi:hypothetical protein FA15DRAFT_655832 [Coprinopsis marcescibilis]|uniref:Fungal-type protein kinase domain-containing protein n=1 Tax=Coprinopsis marcescibilis TaxID=230819 RepID=A0A5C3KW96_COPMA|nr:hypothetical protein FA15DRAFT_655832 [Coprinopsis marcescibilis]